MSSSHYLIGIDEAGRAARKTGRPRPVPYLMGIDEAGRGPLAGPVVVAGVLVPRRTARSIFRGIRDSKKLSPKQREEWFGRIISVPDLRWAAAAVWPRVIDRINITRAGDRGALRVYKRLISILIDSQESRPPQTPKIQFNHDRIKIVSWGGNSIQWSVALDAGLKLPPPILHKAIIKGDEKIPVIAAASIIAKVTRDRIMRRLHKKYPLYRFDLHKGYGTTLHRGIIAAAGISPVHRETFCKDYSPLLLKSLTFTSSGKIISEIE
mgnify:CR=1 FL=1